MQASKLIIGFTEFLKYDEIDFSALLNIVNI
jgi:hypothetical protein